MVLDREWTLEEGLAGSGCHRLKAAWRPLRGSRAASSWPSASQSGPALPSTCPPNWTLERKRVEMKVTWLWKTADGLTPERAKAILIPKAKPASGRGDTMLSSSNRTRAVWLDPKTSGSPGVNTKRSLFLPWERVS